MTTPQNPEPTPPTAPPTAAPAVPYGGAPAAAAAAGVVTINGQDVHLGDNHPLNAVVDMLKAAAQHHTPGTSPSVSVNGQQILGTALNLSSLLTASQMSKIQQGIEQVMTTHPEIAQHLAQMFRAH